MRNVPRTIAAAVASGKATLRDLDEHYSIEDVYDILEVIVVEAHNARVAAKQG